jgi:O-acetyl-ADP-ribose deacetylase (regulator of RNase III)
MLLLKKGNLFEYQHQGYAHGVSNLGKMGKGIAIDFKRKYPSMFTEYKAKCYHKIISPGDCFFYENIIQNQNIFNLITQDNLFNASEKYLKSSINNMHKLALRKNINDIGMPQIACGLGNLQLEKLINNLDIFVSDSKFHVTIYSI